MAKETAAQSIIDAKIAANNEVAAAKKAKNEAPIDSETGAKIIPPTPPHPMLPPPTPPHPMLPPQPNTSTSSEKLQVVDSKGKLVDMDLVQMDLELVQTTYKQLLRNSKNNYALYKILKTNFLKKQKIKPI